MTGTADPLARVRESFACQSMMATLGATLDFVDDGEVHIAVRAGEGLRQQHGFIHGGVLMTIADSAAGYAAMTRVGAEDEVLTIEFKLNFLRPARGHVVAKARVLRPGRQVTVCTADVYDGEHERHVATALGTFAVVQMERAAGR